MSRPAKRLTAVSCVDCGKTTKAWSRTCNACERRIGQLVREGQSEGTVKTAHVLAELEEAAP